VGSEVGVPGRAVGVGGAVLPWDGVRVAEAEGLGLVGEGEGGVVRSLVGGGASGGAGLTGPSERPVVNGSATSSATAQVTPTPVAVRSRRRRDALRRSVS